MKKGQISLEFLIVFFAMIAILIIFMPVFVKVMNSSLLAIDVYNASKKLNELDTEISLLNTLENGSNFEIKFNFIYPIEVLCEDKKFKLIIKSKSIEKEMFIDLDLDCDFQNSFDNAFMLGIEKQDNLKISVIN